MDRAVLAEGARCRTRNFTGGTNAVAVRLLASDDVFSDDPFLLFETLAPQLRAIEVFR
jgi:hypothetical protein